MNFSFFYDSHGISQQCSPHTEKKETSGSFALWYQVRARFSSSLARKALSTRSSKLACCLCPCSAVDANLVRKTSNTRTLTPPTQEDTSLRDLFERLLAKNPGKRLTVPEARYHHWVRSRLGGGGGGGGAGDGDGDGGYGIGSGGTTLPVCRALLLAESSFSSSFSPQSPGQDKGAPFFGGGGGGGDGGDCVGGGEAGGESGDVGRGCGIDFGDVYGERNSSNGGDRGDSTRRHEAPGGASDLPSPRHRFGGGGGELQGFSAKLTASGKRVAVTEEDVRAAVTHAPGLVIVVSARTIYCVSISVLRAAGGSARCSDPLGLSVTRRRSFVEKTDHVRNSQTCMWVTSTTGKASRSCLVLPGFFLYLFCGSDGVRICQVEGMDVFRTIATRTKLGHSAGPVIFQYCLSTRVSTSSPHKPHCPMKCSSFPLLRLATQTNVAPANNRSSSFVSATGLTRPATDPLAETVFSAPGP